jgi:hypothetical protein
VCIKDVKKAIEANPAELIPGHIHVMQVGSTGLGDSSSRQDNQESAQVAQVEMLNQELEVMRRKQAADAKKVLAL